MTKLTRNLILLLMLSVISMSINAQDFYKQIGTDSTWQYILDNRLIPIDENSTAGITGSTIDVNNKLVEAEGLYAQFPIDQNIKIHTVGNSNIPREDFPKWTRWYQEDGHTQVFRLYEGEQNVRNTRRNKVRCEAYSKHSWVFGDGWQTWVGTYTFVNPQNACIFQCKSPGPLDWCLQLNVDAQGNVKLNHRRGEDVIIATEMKGKSIDIKVRDNGYDYEVYLNGELKGKGAMSRKHPDTQKELPSSFRWGMYLGNKLPPSEMMIMVSGATINPENDPYTTTE